MRGVCEECFMAHKEELYRRQQAKYRQAYRKAFLENYEPTEDEVESTVAEQMAKLPDWWPASGRDIDPEGDV